jgi:hypothetical protein
MLLGSIFMLALQLMSGIANAVDIPVTSFTCTQAMTATTTCVGNGFYASGWATGTGYWQYNLNSVGYTGAITMTFKNTKSSAAGPTTGQVYYNIGAGDVAVGTAFTVTTSCVTQIVTLPAACAGQSNLIVRVKMTGATASTATHRITSQSVFDAASSSCTVAPTAGSVSGTTTICGGTSTTLTLTGASGGTGISYQWQSSTNNTTWTDISGATSLTYTTPALSANTYYRAVTTCAAVPTSPATTASVLVTVNTVTVNAITGYVAPLGVGSTQTLSSTTSGGVWSSSNTSVATVDATGHVTGVFGGNAVITYKVTNPTTGCIGTQTANVSVVWPNTLALYAGFNGNSTSVINVPGDTVNTLYAVGFGSNTLCGSGGLSGLTVNLANNSFSEDSAHVGYKVYPQPGKALNMYRIHARARVSGTGPKKAVIAYQTWSNGSGSGWIASSEQTLVSGSCGNSANDWDFNSGLVGNPNPTETGITDSLEVAVFPYAPDTTTGTFQLNSLEVYGVVSPNTNCNGGSIVTTADSVYPAIATICDSGSRFLTYNIGTGGITGPGINYQWEVSTNPTTGFTSISGANGVVYQTPQFNADTVTVDTLYYRVKISCLFASGSASYSTVSLLSIHHSPANAGVVSGAIPSTTSVPFDHMLIPTTYNLTSTVSGGTWSSNDTSVISINPTSGVATPHIPGDAIVTYRSAVNGCFGSTKNTIVAFYPNTKALYVGRNGNSLNVYASTGTTASNLTLANWDSATACSSGGYSGLVNTNPTFNTATNGIAYISVSSATAFSASDIYATVRQQASLTNNYKVRLAYSIDNGVTWVFGAENSADHDDCGYSSTALHYTFPSAISVSTTPVRFAAFGYNGVATTSTLQINSLSVIGNGSVLMKGTGVGNIANNVSNIELYPNPVENTLNVNASENVNVVILSIDGKKLLAQKNATSIDVSSLMSGMYLIQVYGNNNMLLKTEKFIKK